MGSLQSSWIERLTTSVKRTALTQGALAVRKLRPAAGFLRAFLYGATGYEFERQAARIRGDMETLFVFMVMGDSIGVPILPPYYALRLLPYLREIFPTWRRRILRERDPLENEEFDLHGL